jgi:polar amino acid transport system permease protein
MTDQPPSGASASLPASAPPALGRWRWLLKLDRGWLLFIGAVVLLLLVVLAVGARYIAKFPLPLLGVTIRIPVGNPYGRIFEFLWDGIWTTLVLTGTSFLFILVVGMLGGLGRVSHSRIISTIAWLYVEIVRGIPVLVWLLWIWFALPQIIQGTGRALLQACASNPTGWASAIMCPLGQAVSGIKLQPIPAAVLGFTFAYGAYMTEIFRAGIQSIPKGQMEAARSLGMTNIQAMRYIILPQAVRVILPPVGNEFVTLLKDSSLVSILAVSDLTRRGREFVARTFLSFDTFTMVALCYLILTLLFTRVFTAIEHRTSVEKR